MTDEKDNGPEDEAAEGAVKDKDNDSNSKDCPNGNNLIDFQQAKQEGRGAKKGNGTDRVDEKTAEEVRAQLTGIVGLIVDCTNKHAKFFQDPVDGICYARFKKDRHFEVWALNSDGFRRWLQWLCYKTFALDNQKARTPSQQILKNIIQVLEAHAVYNGRPGRVHLRTAFQDGRYYIDLCDDDWRVIQVEAGWWQNVTGTSVYFRRTPGMEPLPMPSASTADLNLLWQHINITHEGDRLIILTSLVAMLSPDIQFPFLEFTGQQGSGKTDTQEFLRMLVDPNAVLSAGAPTTKEDIYIAAINNAVVSYNNLSYINEERQDVFCNLTTGGGIAKRALYTNDTEFAVPIKRPVLVNGITPLATRPDLIDRTIPIHLSKLTYKRTEKSLRAAFKKDLQAIFGGLIELMAQALQVLKGINPDDYDLPRLGDFGLLGESVSQVRGNNPGEFIKLMYERKKAAMQEAVESTPVGTAILAYLGDRGNWNGTVGTLFAILGDEFKPKHTSKQWPGSASGLANAIERLTPALAFVDVAVEWEIDERTGRKRRRNDGYHVWITKTA